MPARTLPATNPVAVPGPALRHWQALHAAGDIQFAPLPPWHQPPPPGWLLALGRFFEWLFAPLARALGAGWPVVKWGLVALAAAALLALAWRLVLALRLRLRRRSAAGATVETWAPRHAEVRALLADADSLAGEGRFDEAAHLLLQRSVAQIAEARPGWLAPASTAREIAALPQLPQLARDAFAVIVRRVEASRYGLRPLGPEDWRAARAAYTEFALQRLVAA